jgi:cobalt-zinc-cadmium efflux system outer membrane protein
VDLNRLELQQLQFESDYETAYVGVRTAKIQPFEQFNVTGRFDFTPELMWLEKFRAVALDNRPDLKAANQNVELAKTNHQLAIANESQIPRSWPSAIRCWRFGLITCRLVGAMRDGPTF